MTDFQTAQQLWAPWRMEFIRAPKEPGCFLCRIIREGSEKDDENLVVYRGAHGLLLMNRFPYTTGHLLAAPLRHEGALTALSAEERQEMLDLACLGQRLLDTVAKPGGYNLGINQGVPAGAGLEEVSLEVETHEAEMLVSGGTLDRWFSAGDEGGRPSYAGHLARRLSPDEIARVESLFRRQLTGQAVSWQSRLAFLAARRPLEGR